MARARHRCRAAGPGAAVGRSTIAPRTRPQRTVTSRRQSERRSEGSREVRLIGESCVERDLDERTPPIDTLAREFETAPEQIAVRTGSEPDPELTRQVVAAQPRDRFQ